MDKINKLKLRDNPVIEKNLLRIVKYNRVTIEKKKILNYIN